jgi:hypothetical protein
MTATEVLMSDTAVPKGTDWMKVLGIPVAVSVAATVIGGGVTGAFGKLLQLPFEDAFIVVVIILIPVELVVGIVVCTALAYEQNHLGNQGSAWFAGGLAALCVVLLVVMAPVGFEAARTLFALPG